MVRPFSRWTSPASVTLVPSKPRVFEAGQSIQMREPCITDLSSSEIHRFQAVQPTQACQASVANPGIFEVQPLQTGHPRQVGYSSVGNLVAPSYHQRFQVR